MTKPGSCVGPCIVVLAWCLAAGAPAANAQAEDAKAAAGIPAPGAPAPGGTDEELAEKVHTALQSDKYFFGKHVTVSVEKGDVVLRGFVLTSWDMRDAVRIAQKAAGDRRVVNNLSLKVGGRR
jgi:osmotically-inducible protein OsmY